MWWILMARFSILTEAVCLFSGTRIVRRLHGVTCGRENQAAVSRASTFCQRWTAAVWTVQLSVRVFVQILCWFSFNVFNVYLYQFFFVCSVLWCSSCMARWFAARATGPFERWLSGRATCPGCRANFCLLDVSPARLAPSWTVALALSTKRPFSGPQIFHIMFLYEQMVKVVLLYLYGPL